VARDVTQDKYGIAGSPPRAGTHMPVVMSLPRLGFPTSSRPAAVPSEESDHVVPVLVCTQVVARGLDKGKLVA
jgi:hypothetical protein